MKPSAFLHRIQVCLMALLLTCLLVPQRARGQELSLNMLAGDVNCDGRVSLVDLTTLIGYLKQGLTLPMANSDLDGDNRMTIADAEAIVDILLNRHEAVDLGLSVCWATMNIGATCVQGYGDYFAWGELQPKTSFTEANYAYYSNDTYQSIGNNICNTKYDAAKALWGSGWHLPTLIDINELKNKCTWTLTTLNGVSVYKVTGPNGNHIYMPLAGYRNGNETLNAGTDFYCWCGMKSSTASSAYCLYSQNYSGTWSASRAYGFTIRPVRAK